jgi:predicted dehydrogenase
MLIVFPSTTPSNLPNRTSHGIGMTSFPLASDPDDRSSAGPAIRIYGTKGEIQVDSMAFQPKVYRIIPFKQGDKPVAVREVSCPFPSDGHGMYYEADEAARCVREGKIESETMPWDESIMIMQVMDEIRRQGGLVYPNEIETPVE